MCADSEDEHASAWLEQCCGARPQASAGAGKAGVKGCLSVGAAVAVLVAIGIYSAFPHPTHNEATLKALRAESLVLLASKRTYTGPDLPKSQWPLAIAKLRPTFIIVYPDSVEIVTKPFFDGGWGYHVARDDRASPKPAGRYSKLDQGVYWFHPY